MAKLVVPVLFLSFIPAVAFAGGLYVGEPDVVSMGQAGANIAAPSTMGAFWYNPASLAHNRGLQFQLEGGFQYTPVTYQRDFNTTTSESYGLATNKTPYRPAFFAGVTYDFGVPDLAVGLAVYTPVAGNYSYSESGSQRYQAISSDITVLHFHLAVAYRVFRWMSLGITFGDTYFSTVQKVAVAASPTSNPEDPDFSTPFTMDVRDPFTITSNFGVRFDPIPELTIGASITPPYDFLATGTATTQIPEALGNLGVSVSGNKISLGLHVPMVARVGVRYRPIDRLGIEAAFIWEQWSRYDAATATPDDIRITAPIAGLSDGVQLPVVQLKKNYIDVYSARLGAEVRIIDQVVVRAGTYFETSATKTTFFDITVPDANKIGFSVGASVKVGPIWLDAAYVHARPFSDVRVSNSEISTIAVIPGGASATVGNGTYAFNVNVAHFGIRGSFFDKPKLPPPLEPASVSVDMPDAFTPPSASAPTTMPSP